MIEPNEVVWAEERVLSIWKESNWIYGLGYENDLASEFDVEEELIKRDLFRKLSDTSREIVNIILDPDDYICRGLFTPKTKNITKRTLKKFLKELGIPVKNISSSFKELRRLASHL